MAVDQLTDLMTVEPSKRKEIIKDKQFLSSQKLGANEADIEKINNRRICSANGGLPPMVKRQQYYASLQEAA